MVWKILYSALMCDFVGLFVMHMYVLRAFNASLGALDIVSISIIIVGIYPKR